MSRGCSPCSLWPLALIEFTGASRYELIALFWRYGTSKFIALAIRPLWVEGRFMIDAK